MVEKGLVDTLYQRLGNLYDMVYANRKDTTRSLVLKLKGLLKLMVGKHKV